MITGSVQAATTGQPVNGAQVTIEGTTRGALTNASGRFLITNVQPGTYNVQIVYVGYGSQTREVTVSGGETAVVDFQLSVSAVSLDEIVVTGTAGAVERRKIGVSLASMDMAQIQEAQPMTAFGQALEGRIPGLRSIGTVGGVGATRELRIRGTDSFSLGQRPVVYIDGVRVDGGGGEWGDDAGGSSTCCAFSGGAGEDRLSDLNPDEIDRVEVIKGPAAATLYGSEASGGVIQIFTKRGRNNSPANFSLTSSLGFNRHRENFPTHMRSELQIKGPDGFVAWDPNETLIENGLINSYDLTVDGGGEAVTYFVSAGFNYEEGSVKPNDQKRGNLRVNLNWSVGDNLTIGVASGYVRNRIYALQSGNNWLGIYTNALLSNPRNATADAPYGGGLDVTVEDSKAISTYSDTDRWTGSVTMTYNPLPNFTHKATIGLDAVNDQKTRILPFGRHYTYIGKNGERNIGYRSARKFTADYLANLDYDLPILGGLPGSFAFGGQAYWDVASLSMATGKDYAATGVTTVGGGARTFGGETFEEEVNIGAFAQNRFDLGNLFVTAAVRIDGNSAFGENYGFQVYPKADAAYNLPSDALPGFVSSVKLRGAVGMAGKAPGAFDQFRTYDSNTVLDDQPGVIPYNPGNTDLQPENKTEYEAGIELGLFDSRVGIDATFYNATTKNALLEIPFPPSLGFQDEQLQNVGRILNRGIEVSVNSTILDRSSFRWATMVNYEWNHNEVLDLGATAVSDSLPIYDPDGGNTPIGWDYHERLGGFRTGYPVGTFVSRMIVGWDETSRAHIRSTYAAYLGKLFPGHLASWNNDFALGQSLRLNVQFRGEWGAVMANSDRSYGVRQYAYDEYNRHLDANGDPTPAADSVLNYMRLVTPADSRDNIRLQELSLSYQLPESITTALGLDRSSLTLAGYNLYWWDHCNCPDPNQQYQGGADFSTSPFLGLPQPRRFLLSFRTRF
ncbi:MAG: carboxypeptidase-like regulatory domain-containing protein [Gemmatimonadota bacterium]|nr:carboxypeptidase-like regulatory domain-containing protein [Gemmatimonadota bacterium]